ncbi:protein of unknown function [Methylocaldum szegediense]|uniref:Uncharacterized protein n=1 Tax=Methylocaldum szegediense TaxID=73780 RepID=A0ABM9I3G6_9GAMM|nr:protein of unknown function [Methylocaldum szegediense]
MAVDMAVATVMPFAIDNPVNMSIALVLA